MDKETVLITAMILVAAPFATTMAGANADDNATWGLCQADEANEEGDNSSNGTIDETPPFENTSEEDCEDAEHPANGTPGEDHVPEDPGPPEDPGAPDDTPDGDDNPGDDHPDDEDNPGDDNPGEDDNPDEDDNPGDDQGPP